MSTVFSRKLALKGSSAFACSSKACFSTSIAVRALPNFLPDAAKEFPDYKIPKNYIPPPKREPLLPWDDRQNRRNFGEPVHPWHDYIDLWSPDYFDHVTNKKAVQGFFTFFGGLALFAGIIYVFELYPDRPNMPRSYPHEGLYRDLGGREGEQKLYQANPDKSL
ncbi:unnamed protein product [Ambrosiozyma monospora]|uniref:Unnamed protein product n=1 Tax=Ambrosiozyma monospora TaxID=43982 RepID=A0ACB5T6E8_AMBMO|nr:unnamed protein product [Ambrosiozyma monospora]